MSPLALPRALAAAALACALVAVLPAPASADLVSHIEHPTRVPAFSFISLGNGIEPGSSGVYGFTMTNRYNASMLNVSLKVEVYRFATVEVNRNITAVAGAPTFAQGGGFAVTLSFPSIPSNGSETVRLPVNAPRDAPDGVFFTRQWLEFDYPNMTEPPAVTPYSQHFTMKSRGYFTDAEYAAINYSDLHDSLAAQNISGIIPDSSFSVKAAAPLWPLATLVAATVVSGFFAVAYALVDQSPGRHRRLERWLVRMEGKVRIWRALLRTMLKGKGGARAKGK